MKYKRKALSILVSIMTVLVLFPALGFEGAYASFGPFGGTIPNPLAATDNALLASTGEAVIAAAGEATITADDKNGTLEVSSISYQTPKGKYAFGYIGDSYFDYHVDGAKITLKYTNGVSETYTYNAYNEYTGAKDGFYKDNRTARLDEEKLYYPVENGSIVKGKDNAGHLEYDTGDGTVVSESFPVEGISDENVVSVYYYQHKNWEGIYSLYNGRVSYYTADNLVGDSITVYAYANGSWNSYTNDWNKYMVRKTYYCQQGEDGSYAFESYDGDQCWPSFVDDQDKDPWSPGDTREVSIYYYGVEADSKATVIVGDAVVPEKIEFVPTEGYEFNAYIGDTYVDTWSMAGPGNKFVVTYSDGSKKKYVYKAKKKTAGFYCGDVSKKDTFECWGEVKDGLHKGTQDVELSYHYYDKGRKENMEIPFTVSLTVTKFTAVVDGGEYTYNGRAICPKLSVKNSEGTVLSRGAYTYEKPQNTEVGKYNIQIKMKDKENYVTSAWGEYSICPERVEADSIEAGKNSLKISWKEFSEDSKSQIDGFLIEYSTGKDFEKYETLEAGKDDTSAEIEDLDNGKTYYVRVYAYKSVEFDGEEVVLKSIKPSKVKKIEVH
jgi:hypothetical protein